MWTVLQMRHWVHSSLLRERNSFKTMYVHLFSIYNTCLFVTVIWCIVWTNHHILNWLLLSGYCQWGCFWRCYGFKPSNTTVEGLTWLLFIPFFLFTLYAETGQNVYKQCLQEELNFFKRPLSFRSTIFTETKSGKNNEGSITVVPGNNLEHPECSDLLHSSRASGSPRISSKKVWLIFISIIYSLFTYYHMRLSTI